jgi:hypothetical protein
MFESGWPDMPAECRTPKRDDQVKSPSRFGSLSEQDLSANPSPVAARENREALSGSCAKRAGKSLTRQWCSDATDLTDRHIGSRASRPTLRL